MLKMNVKEGNEMNVRREIDLMNRLSHPNVIKFYGVCISSGQMHALVEVGGMVWCGVVWCNVAWCGVGWHGVMWHGVVWYGMVWCGVAWCGVVWWGVVLWGVV